MLKKMGLLIFAMAFSACAAKPTYDEAMLDKYPKCYHQNIKIYQKCIKKNEAGEAITAIELENKAFPGQYK